MKTKHAEQFFEILNTYPSPHNGQPIRLKQTAPGHYAAFFQKERGLQATDISFIFSFVSMGVFCAYAELCGKALGHKVTYSPTLPSENELKGTGTIKFADISVAWNELPPDESLLAALQFRQTSRKKYSSGISENARDQITQIAQHARAELIKLSEPQKNQAIWLNQRAVFDDMFDEAVKKELDHWLRYSKKEKEQKRDGLAYDCMQLNGTVMKFIVKHPRLLHLPAVSYALEKYYLRTMVDRSDVFYMMAPFKTEDQSFTVGTVISKIWITLSAQGYYLHPFGTIMSNNEAHQDFLKLMHTAHESRDSSYLVFIFRAGKSTTPVRSLRLPYNEHLLME